VHVSSGLNKISDTTARLPSTSPISKIVSYRGMTAREIIFLVSKIQAYDSWQNSALRMILI
jgi:hypothetical protein